MHWLVLVVGVLFVLAAIRLLVAVTARVFSWIPWASVRRVYAVLCAVTGGTGIGVIFLASLFFPDTWKDETQAFHRLHEELPTIAWLTAGLLIAAGVGFLVFLVQGMWPQSDVPYQPRGAVWRIRRLLKYVVGLGLLWVLVILGQDIELRWRLRSLRAESGALAADMAPKAIPDKLNAAIHYGQAARLLGDAVRWEDEHLRDEVGEVRRSVLDERATEYAQLLEPMVQQFLLAAELPGCRFADDYQALICWYDPQRDERPGDAVRRLMWYAIHKARKQQPEVSIRCVVAIRRFEEHLLLDPRNTDTYEFSRYELWSREIIACLAAYCETLPEEPMLALVVAPLPVDHVSQNNLKWMAAVSRCRLADLYTVRSDSRNWSWGDEEFPADSLRGRVYFFARRFLGCRDDLQALTSAHRITRNPQRPDSLDVRYVKEAWPRGRYRWAVESTRGGRHWAVLAECHRRLANLAVAATLYRKKQGEWPTALAKLAPTWLAEIPSVPETGAAFLFKNVEDGMIVYCPENAGAYDAFDDSRRWWKTRYQESFSKPAVYLGQAYLRVMDAAE